MRFENSFLYNIDTPHLISLSSFDQEGQGMGMYERVNMGMRMNEGVNMGMRMNE